MGIHEDSTLHTVGVESKTRGEQIVTARLIGYSWVSIADSPTDSTFTYHDGTWIQENQI